VTYGHAPQTLFPDATSADDIAYWRQVAAFRASECYRLADEMATKLDQTAAHWEADAAAPLKRVAALLHDAAMIVRGMKA
jgi:hypothetical protein